MSRGGACTVRQRGLVRPPRLTSAGDAGEHQAERRRRPPARSLPQQYHTPAKAHDGYQVVDLGQAGGADGAHQIEVQQRGGTGGQHAENRSGGE